MGPIILTAICCIICFIACVSTFQFIKRKVNEFKLRQAEAVEWEERYSFAERGVEELKLQQAQIHGEITALEGSAQRLRDQADESAQAYYDEKMTATKLRLGNELKEEERKFEEARQEYQDTYLNLLAERSAEMAKYGVTARQLIESIEDMQSKVRAAIEAQKRAMEEKDKINFYRIQIPESDLLEIAKLREILPYLRDKDALNKVIYKIYYENPTNDLIGRVIGKKQGGIYKITNINNGMCYVGQAVNFANRWKQHIKRGVGAEPITHNKLYPAMQEEGVENFTFEVIEECPSSKLNEREDYWQNYFGAKEFGYSIR